MHSVVSQFISHTQNAITASFGEYFKEKFVFKGK